MYDLEQCMCSASWLEVCMRRKLLQAASTVVIVNVWTNARGGDFSPSAYWGKVFSSGCLDAVGPFGHKWTGDFLNATTLLRSVNETAIATVYDPPAASRWTVSMVQHHTKLCTYCLLSLFVIIRSVWLDLHSATTIS